MIVNSAHLPDENKSGENRFGATLALAHSTQVLHKKLTSQTLGYYITMIDLGSCCSTVFCRRRQRSSSFVNILHSTISPPSPPISTDEPTKSTVTDTSPDTPEFNWFKAWHPSECFAWCSYYIILFYNVANIIMKLNATTSLLSHNDSCTSRVSS